MTDTTAGAMRRASEITAAWYVDQLGLPGAHLEAEGLAGGREGLQPVQVPLPQEQQVVQLPVVQGQRPEDATPVRL